MNTSTFEHGSAVDEPLEALDPARLQRHPLMTRASWILVALALVAVGFIGGAKVKDHNAANGSGATLPGGFSPPAGFDPTQLRGGLTGATGIPNATTAANAQSTTGAAAANGTFAGTIALINNAKIYVKITDGNPVSARSAHSAASSASTRAPN